MKIGIACHSVYGGSGVVASELGLALARRGHEVHFISNSLPFKLESYQSHIYFHEIEQLSYPLFKNDPFTLSTAVKMAEVAEYENLDILHVHYAIPFAISAYLAKQMLQPRRRIKVVTTLHGTDITIVGSDTSYFDITRFAIEKSDALTAVSNSLRDATYANFKIEKEIRVIYNFIDPNRYKREFCPDRRRDFAREDEKILIHISNFRPVKRLEDVIRIFHHVRRQIPAKLILVGDGPDRWHSQQLVKNMGIQKDVIFLGKQNCVIGLLSISDLFLLPSESESFGLAALEANACETPVVGTNSGGLPEVIRQEETGMLRPIRDVKNMGKDSLRILTDPDLHQYMRDASRRRAVEHFSEDAMLQSYESLYQKVFDND